MCDFDIHFDIPIDYLKENPGFRLIHYIMKHRDKYTNICFYPKQIEKEFKLSFSEAINLLNPVVQADGNHSIKVIDLKHLTLIYKTYCTEYQISMM